LRILVVDDEKDIPVLFEQRFKSEIKSGLFEFHYAFSSEEALHYLDNQLHPHLMLILSDINMPGINGLDLLKIIKRRHPSIIVIMLTAYGDAYNSQLAYEYGAEEIINKPINFLYLKNLLLDLKRIYTSKEEGSANDQNSSR
jgi:DNA-binding NtrC family response regulator